MNNQYIVTLPSSLSPLEQEEIQRGFIVHVYGWMMIGLLLTAAAALAPNPGRTCLWVPCSPWST